MKTVVRWVIESRAQDGHVSRESFADAWKAKRHMEGKMAGWPKGYSTSTRMVKVTTTTEELIAGPNW